MKTIIIIKITFVTVCLSAIFFACTTKQKTREELKSEIKEITGELHEKYLEEKIKLAATAEQIISEYNSKAENIKIEAIRNKRNLDMEVKKKLIDMETRIERLENKLENLKYQTDDSWIKFRDELNHDINSIKEGIKDLSRNNVG